jgi:hypothetical protein
MKKILFALIVLVCVVSALPQARGADVSVDFFYNNLSGGNWIDVGDYGYGWQPDVATSDPNWRPYSDGYWAYTDYGWTWISYEDFGWATYHYGRWANLDDYGWVWFPGNDLDWGPAWVSWRTGGDYIGWAPLPPRGPEVVYEGRPIGASVDIEFDIGPEYYNFCDIRFIGEPVLRDRIFPVTQNITYITNTVNVTNIYTQNNVVYNYGPNYNVVNQYSSRPIQRLTIERQNATDLSAAAKSGALTKVQGNKLVVAAPPKLAKAPSTVAPPAVKAKVAQPKIEHGWKGVSNKAELEQKIKSQNPKNIPPPTRAAARPEGSAPAGGAGSPAAREEKIPVSPAQRGKAERVPPGATAAPGGLSASPFERGKGRSGPPRPGATMSPPRSPAGISTSPIERGKGRERPGAQPGTTTPPKPGEGGPPSERGKAHGKPGTSPPETNRERGVVPPVERQAPPVRNLGESAAPRNVPPESRGNEPEHQRLGNPPAPAGAAEHERRAPEHRPPTGAPAGEAGAAREKGPAAHGQPGGPPPPRGGAPAAGERPRGGPPSAGAERGQAQPERGKKKPERESPPPRP